MKRPAPMYKASDEDEIVTLEVELLVPVTVRLKVTDDGDGSVVVSAKVKPSALVKLADRVETDCTDAIEEAVEAWKEKRRENDPDYIG